jgi:hypothetical protein
LPQCGVIYHIDWVSHTSFTLQSNGTFISSIQPNNIYVDLTNSPPSDRFPMIPTHWPSSVMPIFQVTAAATIKGPPLSIKGFPLVPAFGTTVHGVQGETRDSVAITSLRPPHVRHVDQHALYVALSRIRTRHGLYWIGDRPTTDDYEYFQPSAEILLEDNRLKHLSNTTISQFDRQLPP